MNHQTNLCHASSQQPSSPLSLRLFDIIATTSHIETAIVIPSKIHATATISVNEFEREQQDDYYYCIYTQEVRAPYDHTHHKGHT
jgi:hypothetical protein